MLRPLFHASLCLVFLGACTIANPDYEPESQIEPDASPEQSSCVPSTFLGCEGFHLLRCSAEGERVAEDCHPYHCNPRARGCNRCEPEVQLYCEGDDLVFCTAMGNPMRFPCERGCQGGRCIECTVRTFYLDSDGDGHGDPSQSLEACEPPHGYVAVADDCNDADSRAHPAQTGFFSEPDGAGSYDYNCDGIEEQQHSTTAWCNGDANGTGCVGDGWALGVPGCGTSGLLAHCTPYLGLVCGPVPSPDVQRCR